MLKRLPIILASLAALALFALPVLAAPPAQTAHHLLQRAQTARGSTPSTAYSTGVQRRGGLEQGSNARTVLRRT